MTVFRRRAKAAAWRPLSWWRELIIVAVIYGSYEASRGVADSDPGPATRTGRAILNWETTWHLDPERALNRWIQHSVPLEVVAAYFYSTMHYVITPAVLIWMFVKHAPQYRFARTVLALSTVFGLLGFYFLPTAPPRLIPGSGIADTLARVADYGWWSNHGSVPRGLASIANQFAAMPSLHVGWAIWCGYLLWRHGKHLVTRCLGVVYPIATTLVVLSTGNHYLLDAVAGAVVMLFATGVAYLLHYRSVIREAQAITAQNAEAPHEATQPAHCPAA